MEGGSTGTWCPENVSATDKMLHFQNKSIYTKTYFFQDFSVVIGIGNMVTTATYSIILEKNFPKEFWKNHSKLSFMEQASKKVSIKNWIIPLVWDWDCPVFVDCIGFK